MAPPRLSAARLKDHLCLEPPEVRRTVLALRRAILKAVPAAAEAVKFRCLCYYHADAWFGSIGGNICLIEVKGGRVALSFLHGASLEDPKGLLRGRGKAKRFVPVADAKAAGDAPIAALVRAAAALRPWD